MEAGHLQPGTRFFTRAAGRKTCLMRVMLELDGWRDNRPILRTGVERVGDTIVAVDVDSGDVYVVAASLRVTLAPIDPESPCGDPNA